MAGPANCKKTTRHNAYLSLCAKSRKTNDVKSRKWPKTSIWAIFWRFRGQISPNCKFFWKIGSFKLKVIFSTNFRPKTKKIEPFLRKISVSDFGLIWRLFCENLQIKKFFFKNPAVTFLPLQSPNFMQNIRKILRAVSEKTASPTNQTTNQLLPTTPIL